MPAARLINLSFAIISKQQLTVIKLQSIQVDQHMPVCSKVRAFQKLHSKQVVIMCNFHAKVNIKHTENTKVVGEHCRRHFPTLHHQAISDVCRQDRPVCSQALAGIDEFVFHPSKALDLGWLPASSGASFDHIACNTDTIQQGTCRHTIYSAPSYISNWS